MRVISSRHRIVPARYHPSYTNVMLLSQFQSPYTRRIYGGHITGLCKTRQEQVEKEIVKAQSSGLIPTYHRSVEFLEDPKLFDPERSLPKTLSCYRKNSNQSHLHSRSRKCQPTLTPIQHFNTMDETRARIMVVAYWCRLYALQSRLKLSTHQPDETKLILAIMDWLETVKKVNADNDSIINEVAPQAHLENYALKLFLYADREDRDSNFGKNVVKAFYASGILYDVMQTFGELTEEAIHNRKYAKWKAAYIRNCLKNGETPVSGPMAEEGQGGKECEGQPSPPQDPSPDQPGAASQPKTPQTSPDEPVALPSTLTADRVLQNPDMLPKPPVDEEKYPGGFIPFVSQPGVVPLPTQYVPPPVDILLTPDQMIKAQKYCKYAGSALNFNDVKMAICRRPDNFKPQEKNRGCFLEANCCL